MVRKALYFLGFLITASTSVYAQEDVAAPPAGTAATAPATGQNTPAPYTFESLDHLSIPSPSIPPIPDIPSPKIPTFPTIASPVIPEFPEIPTPETKFTEFELPALKSIASPPSLPPLKIATPSAQPFFPSNEGGGEKTSPQNVSSTPIPSPLSPYTWGKSSSPISTPLPLQELTPVPQTPYIWGTSSTPISAPLALQPLTPNILTPYSWGTSSTPIAAPQTLNVQTPYTWGKSSTPVTTSTAAPNLGRPSTPNGPSSTPRGQTSTPQGGSSTPHGASSTPHGESSTPRAR